MRHHLWHSVHLVAARYRALRDDPPAGFSFVEMMVVTVIIGTLSSMAAPSLQRAREQVMVGAAIAEIRIVSSELAVYIEFNFEPPVSLAVIDRHDLLDPWGSPYYYKSIAGQQGNGGVRKNKFQVPLNSDYDLYSAGADGETKSPLTAKASKDDVLRALDGAFIGLAEDF